MKKSDNKIVRKFFLTLGEMVKLLLGTEFIQLTNVSYNIKEAKILRQFEKSVRNPLAHLIKSFDEEELHRTTNFSSDEFLNQIIYLARQAGVYYDTTVFFTLIILI